MVKIVRGNITNIEFESLMSKFEFYDDRGDNICLKIDGKDLYAFDRKELKIVAESLLEMVGE